jgi:hypothetical protein
MDAQRERPPLILWQPVQHVEGGLEQGSRVQTPCSEVMVAAEDRQDKAAPEQEWRRASTVQLELVEAGPHLAGEVEQGCAQQPEREDDALGHE